MEKLEGVYFKGIVWRERFTKSRLWQKQVAFAFAFRNMSLRPFLFKHLGRMKVFIYSSSKYLLNAYSIARYSEQNIQSPCSQEAYIPVVGYYNKQLNI